MTGSQLRSLRKQLNWPQWKLAYALRFSPGSKAQLQSRVCELENGKKRICKRIDYIARQLQQYASGKPVTLPVDILSLFDNP